MVQRKKKEKKNLHIKLRSIAIVDTPRMKNQKVEMVQPVKDSKININMMEIK